MAHTRGLAQKARRVRSELKIETLSDHLKFFSDKLRALRQMFLECTRVGDDYGSYQKNQQPFADTMSV